MSFTNAYSQENQKDNQETLISMELLLMLGEFEQQDDSWLDNELSSKDILNEDSKKQIPNKTKGAANE